MATWAEFSAAEPLLATAIRTLICQYGPGMGYLATIRPDGGPRVHPVMPVITDAGLYCFILPSPKRHDLDRDGRYALHSFSAVEVDDEFYLTGRAALRPDADLAERVRGAFLATGATSTNDEMLFEFDLEHALLSTYKKRGEPDNFPPVYSKWHAPEVR